MTITVDLKTLRTEAVLDFLVRRDGLSDLLERLSHVIAQHARKAEDPRLEVALRSMERVIDDAQQEVSRAEESCLGIKFLGDKRHERQTDGRT